MWIIGICVFYIILIFSVSACGKKDSTQHSKAQSEWLESLNGHDTTTSGGEERL